MNTQISLLPDGDPRLIKINWTVTEEVGYHYDLTTGVRTDVRTGETTKDWSPEEWK